MGESAKTTRKRMPEIHKIYQIGDPSPCKTNKNSLGLWPTGVLDLVSKLVGRKAHFFESWMLFCCNWFVRFRKLLVFCCFTCAKMRAKNRIEINQKSVPNEPKIIQKSTPNLSKICQKSTPNRSKIALWRGRRFFMIFGHILDPFLDPFSIHFRPQNDLKNMSKITCENRSKNVRF